jgi:hypothetical protein
MKIQVDGKTIFVEFRHLYTHDRKPYATECVVLTQADAQQQPDYNQHNPKYVLALADSTCHERDQFDRSVGRRLSLTRALIGYKPRVERSKFKVPFTREQRTQIWKQYLERNEKR